MNALKMIKTNEEQITPKDALSLVEKLVSNNLIRVLHEPNYPDTRKDICLVKATIMEMSGSFDVVYIIWKKSGELAHEVLWGTTIYDPPAARHLTIGYLIEDKKTMLVKLYPSSDPYKGQTSSLGTIYSISKEKLGMN